jgi:hypothetical protein
MNRLGKRPPKRAHFFGVRQQRLPDELLCLASRVSERHHAGKVRQVRTPATVLGLFEDHDVLAHRSCSRPLAFRMLVRINQETGAIEWPGHVDLDPLVLYGLDEPATGPPLTMCKLRPLQNWLVEIILLAESLDASVRAMCADVVAIGKRLERVAQRGA